MLLKRAKLVNVCQHVNTDIEFKAGLTIVCGPNGVGKSNLMSMVRTSITNDFASVEGVKEDNIRRGTPADAVAYVETVWQVLAGELLIRRVLQGGKSLLSLNGKDLVRGRETEITNKALELMGVNAAIVNDFLFASQDRLQDVIGGTKATRASLFQSLCGLDKLDKLDKLMRDQINVESGKCDAFDADRHNQLEAEWQSKSAAYRRLKSKVQELADNTASLDELNKARETISRRDKLEEARANIKRAHERKRYSSQKIASFKEDLDGLQISKEDLTNQLAQANRDLLGAQQVRSRFNGLPGKDDVLRAQEAVARAHLNVEPVVTRPAADMLCKGNTAVSILMSREITLKQELAAIANKEWTVCPVCGKEADRDENNELLKQNKEQALADTVSKLAKTKEAVAKLKAAEQSWINYELETANLERKQNVLDKVTSVLPVEEFLVTDTASLAKDVAAFTAEVTELKQKLDKATRLVDAVNKEIGATEYGLQLADELEQEAQSFVASCDPNLTALANKAEIFVSDNEARILALQEQQAILAQENKQLSIVLTRYRDSRAQQRKTKLTRQLIENLSSARSVVHRDRLPARIISGMLAQTVSKINEHLTAFGMPFTVDVDPSEFSFKARHRDGATEAATRLSVGQKLALAIAFWLARSNVFAGRLPFFCLDEPTAHLDEERVMQAVSVFGKLSTELSASGRQGIVITHHKSLSSAGNLIDLSYLKTR